jgi:glutamate-5-semialdehyde dehydrogenase
MTPIDSTPLVKSLAELAQATTLALRLAPEATRRAAILSIREALQDHEAEIFAANALDVEEGQRNGLSSAILDRLTLTAKRLQTLGDSLVQIAEAPAVVGLIEEQRTRGDGLEIIKQRIPLGVIGVIFESRPNVLIDCAALAIKSGNAILLKGGRDAARSNAVLGHLVRQAIAAHLPLECVQVIPAGDRQLTLEMVKLTGLIDLIIPRGGEGLIRMVTEHARVPVIAHAKGLCHLYLHADAPRDEAIAITLNAKTQRPGVCNALETLLIHESLLTRYGPELFLLLQTAGVQLRVDTRIHHLLPDMGFQIAEDEDWDTEYLDLILAVKVVSGVEEAIAHIQKHGSRHTEAIIARDPEVIELFQTAVDASCIAVNASTRFNDGGELGLGAEIGISTSKLHAYGPMGAKEMTTSRFLLRGAGHCRS